MSKPFDIDAVRADFPILHREVHGKPLVYLDNGASAQKPRAVIDAVSHAYENEYANVHRGLHFLSNAATDAYEAARGKVRAYGWAMAHMSEGDEIVLSIAEHHSNIVPWHFLRERMGVKLVWVDCDDEGAITPQAVDAACSDKTKLIAITHMSNVLGTVVDVKSVCANARKRCIKVMIDGSQGAVHMPVDVQDIDCDWYCITGHKLYGPSGIGVLYGKADALDAMRPYQGGGEMILDVTLDDVTYNDPPHRFEAGTPPIVQAIGLGAALDYMESLGRENIADHEADLRDYARTKLREINTLRMIGDTLDKGAIFSFELEGIHAHDVSMVIDRAGVAVRAGTHCAQPLLKRFNVTSTCRASFGLYNTRQEVDALVESLEKARKFFA